MQVFGHALLHLVLHGRPRRLNSKTTGTLTPWAAECWNISAKWRVFAAHLGHIVHPYFFKPTNIFVWHHNTIFVIENSRKGTSRKSGWVLSWIKFAQLSNNNRHYLGFSKCCCVFGEWWIKKMTESRLAANPPPFLNIRKPLQPYFWRGCYLSP